MRNRPMTSTTPIRTSPGPTVGAAAAGTRLLLRLVGSIAVLLSLLPTPPAAAATCEVPDTYSTIQAAVDDSSCDPILVSAGTYAEAVSISRSLWMIGLDPGAATIEGRIAIHEDSAEVDVKIWDMVVAAKGESLPAVMVSGGAELTGSNLDVTHLRNSIFCDGFESGDTSAWSETFGD